eukprot:838274-Rhodomonas_salina.2
MCGTAKVYGAMRCTGLSLRYVSTAHYKHTLPQHRTRHIKCVAAYPMSVPDIPSQYRTFRRKRVAAYLNTAYTSEDT